ncbi:ABC transporter permease [Clostridium sp. YIM B02515]|uniref:ABC transporter permease n=1 Tax=Clostridium rhizosphaerae TaxID=2803861 RepID=A0ABS1T7U7_9CLOT|nr:ABC transporter permease [Clostridium rhizosphaerae]MBL4935405.1 ABC transporter permease [Clostridium rhizosphaerae]
MLAILGKELRSYFYSATGYVFMGIFLLICGIFFANYNLLAASTAYSNVLSSIIFLFLILVPILTMKLLAEERNQKTDQLLLTSPLSVGEIVIGKYLASVVLFFITLAVTFLYPLILSQYGTLPTGEIVTAYIGFALMGASFIAVGLFVSSLTENQVIAAVSSFGMLLLIWILDWIQKGLPTGRNSGIVFAAILVLALASLIYMSTKNIIVTAAEIILGAAVMLIIFFKNSTLYEGFLPKFFEWFSLIKRFDNFSIGILDVSSIIFYLTFSIAFVYLSILMMEKRRWS